MVRALPKELQEAMKEGYAYLSWVTPLDSDVSPFDWFKKSRHHYPQERFYWETPDGRQSLTGFGQEEVFTGDDASFEKVQQFQSTVKARVFQNSACEGTGCLLLGGFSFDERAVSCDVWGDMTQGYFFIPTFSVTTYCEKTYITTTIKVTPDTVLENEWQRRMLVLESISETDSVLEKDTGSNVQTEEVGVPDWLNLVEHAVHDIKRHESLKKVVVARQMAVSSDSLLSVDHVLTRLKQQQQQTYFFALGSPSHFFVGATPERLLRASKETFETASIAGSTPRGATEFEDHTLGEALLSDQKNVGEHQIVVKRIVKELETLTGTQVFSHAPSLLKNRDIQHLFVPLSVVRPENVSFLTGVKRLHPTPALGGEPKQEALDWLLAHEALTRGLYGSPIGWLSLMEDVGEYVVGIRSGVFTEDRGYLFAGCGIVEASRPEMERLETQVKFRPMLRSIGGEVI